ncbi:MAG: valine--tRNA ligase, partial [Candidatus Aenigmatarchaeota archaeon]
MVIMMESKYDPKLVEKKWQKFWADNQIYKFNTESEKPVFSIDTPPPTVSGGMHLGHALSYTHADFIARFWRMMGYNVFYPFGFDDNGLATERLVEKKINMNSSDMTREEFIKLCLEKTKEAEKELKRQFTLIGLSVDWSINYRTISDYCRKISQLSFLRLYKMGRVYQKETPFMWCPKCHTAIAQAELEDVEQATFFNDIIFETEDGKKLVISTTRPELLPACVAVFVHPEDERYKDYVGKKVIVPLFGHKVSILKDERVDPEKGTGIVMCCTFGDQTDMEWYQ